MGIGFFRFSYDANHIAKRLNRIIPRRGFFRKHNGIRPVQNGRLRHPRPRPWLVVAHLPWITASG